MSWKRLLNESFLHLISMNGTPHESFMEALSGLNISMEYNVTKQDNDQNYTDEFNVIDHPAVQSIFYLIYTVVFVLGVFGNVLVCYVVLRTKAMQTVTNYFITNLALSDILLCVLAVPFTPLYSFLGRWVFGKIMCHMVSYAQGVSVYISTLTLTSIAIDRFFVIIYPFKPRMEVTTCLLIITGIWIVAIVATLPYGIFVDLVEYTDLPGIYFCEEAWPEDASRQTFSIFTTIMQFAVPFVIITLCYTRVSIRLSDRTRSKPGVKSSKREEMDRERKRRTNIMLISMVTIFGVCWLPLNVVNLLSDLVAPVGTWYLYKLFFFISHAIAMSSTCYNPFLYAWLNENFRKEFRNVLPFFNDAPFGRRRTDYSSERTCNGNDTVHETLVTSNSIKLTNMNKDSNTHKTNGTNCGETTKLQIEQAQV